MSDKIYAAITEDFIRRMRNWAKAGAGLLSARGSISSIYTHGVRVDRYVSTTPPLLMGEADDTDTALLLVPIRYRQAVQQFWRHEGLSLRDHGRKLRKAPPLNHEVFQDWVLKGHEILLGVLAARSHGYHAAAMHNAASMQTSP